MKSYCLRIVTCLLALVMASPGPAWAMDLFAAFTLPVSGQESKLFEGEALQMLLAAAFREPISRRSFCVFVAGATAALAQELQDRSKQSFPPKPMVLDVENLSHVWIQGPSPTGPLRTVKEVVDFVLRRHLDLATAWEKLVKERDELRLELMRRSTLTLTTDRNHPGPEFSTGTGGLAASVRDFVLYPLGHWENTGNLVDSLSDSSRPRDRLLDLLQGGIEIHSKGQKLEYDATRLKVLMQFRKAYTETIEIPAEKIVADKVRVFLDMADWDAKIYYQKLEIQNWERAIAFFEENKTSGARQADLIRAKDTLSIALAGLKKLENRRSQKELEFFRGFSKQDREAMTQRVGQPVPLGGLQPPWTPGHMKTPTDVPLISNDAYWQHLVYWYQLEEKPAPPPPAPPKPAPSKPTTTKKPAATNKSSSNKPASAKTPAVPTAPKPAVPTALNWDILAKRFEQKGMSSIAGRVRELAKLAPKGLNLSDPAVRDLYFKIQFPIRSDQTSPLPALPAGDQPADRLSGLPDSGQDLTHPVASAVQRHLVLSHDSDDALKNLYDAKEKNLTHFDISFFGLIATILNVRIEPAIAAKIGTKDEKAALQQLRKITADDQKIIRTQLETDQSNEQIDWEDRQKAVTGARDQISIRWIGLAEQMDELTKQFVDREGKPVKREAGPDLADPVLNAKNAMEDIEVAQLAAVRAQTNLALQSTLRRTIYERLAELAQAAARVEFNSDIVKGALLLVGAEIARRLDQARYPSIATQAASMFDFFSSSWESLWKLFLRLSDWVIYANGATALVLLGLTFAIPFVQVRWFKETPRPVSWSISIIMAAGFAYFLPYGIFWQGMSMAMLAVVSQAVMPYREPEFESLRQMASNAGLMARRAAGGVMLGGAVTLLLQAFGRKGMPFLNKNAEEIERERHRLFVSSGIGTKQEEYVKTYRPPKGISGAVTRIRWPSDGTIQPNQPIVFWTASQAMREYAHKMELSIREAPENAMIVVEIESSPFEASLAGIYQKYQSAEQQRTFFRNRNSGNALASPQERHYEILMNELRLRAQAVLGEVDPLTWEAPSDHAVSFDIQRIALRNTPPQGQSKREQLKVASDRPLPLFRIPYDRPQFIFNQNQAYLFWKYRNDPDVFMRLNDGQKIALKDIIAQERDTSTRPIMPATVSDPYQVRFFVSLRPGAHVTIQTDQDQDTSLAGFYRTKGDSQESEEIRETIEPESYIGFVYPKEGPTPVQSRQHIFEAAIQHEADIQNQAVQHLRNNLSQAEKGTTASGWPGMEDGSETLIKEKAAMADDSARLQAETPALQNAALDLSEEGIDLSEYEGRAVVREENSVLYLKETEVDHWLNDPLVDANSLEHNRAHPQWWRLDTDPILGVDLVLPPKAALEEGNTPQVSLSPRHAKRVSNTARVVTQAIQDAQVRQHPQELEVQFSLNDYLDQFPADASPAVGLVLVQKVKLKTTAYHRRDFLRNFRPVRNAAVASLVAITACLAGNGTVARSDFLVESVASALLMSSFYLSFKALRGTLHLIRNYRQRLEERVSYRSSEAPEARPFQEAHGPAPNTPGEKGFESGNHEHLNSLTRYELRDFSRTDLYKLLPEEVTVPWTPGWAWFANDSLTVLQRAFGWIPAVLKIKTKFKIRKHRLMYRTYKSSNVSLLQCFVIYHKNKHLSALRSTQEKIFHYAAILGLFGGSYALLRFLSPKLLVLLEFVFTQSNPATPWLEGINNPLISVGIAILVVGALGGAIFKFYGEGGPSYWWLTKWMAYGLAAFSRGKNFEDKTGQKVSEVLQFIDAEVMGDGADDTFTRSLDRIGAELTAGLFRTMEESSLDIQQDLAESFFEYDRDVRYGKITTFLEHIGLDLAAHDPLVQGKNGLSQQEHRRAHLEAVRVLLQEGRHPRGILFALLATDNTELALDGIDPERAKDLKIVLDKLPGRSRSMIQGLFDMYSENSRHHQQFRDIHTVTEKISNGHSSAESERKTLEAQFLRLAQGESDLETVIKLIFNVPPGVVIPPLVRRTIVYLLMRRWSKTDPEGMRKTLDKLQLIGAGQLSNYRKDEFLRGAQGEAKATAARLLMAQRHGDEIADSLIEFGIPLSPRPSKRNIYYGPELYANIREGVRLLDKLTRLTRGKAIAASASRALDAFIDVLKIRIPPRLTFWSSWRIHPLYFSQLKPARVNLAPPGREPLVIFSYEGPSITKYLGWHGTVRIIAPAPQTSLLTYFLGDVLLEPRWLTDAFHALETDPHISGVREEHLKWLRANLLGTSLSEPSVKPGGAVGDYLESIGIGWSYETGYSDALMTRIPRFPQLPKNTDPAKIDPAAINRLFHEVGRWDTTIILGPEAVPDFLDTRKSPDARRNRLQWVGA